AGAQDELARSHHLFALWYLKAGQWNQAEAEMKQAMALRKELVRAHPDQTDYRLSLVQLHLNHGIVYRARHPARAELELGQARAQCEELYQALPESEDVQDTLATCHQNLAILCSDLRRYRE